MRIPLLQLKVEQLTPREVMWLCDKLLPPIEYTSVEQIRKELLHYVEISNSHYTKADNLYRQSKNYLLHDAELEWIKESDIRLLRWIIYYIQTRHRETHPPINLSAYWPDTGKYERLIQTLDIWDASAGTKRTTLDTAKFLWSEILLQNKKLRWLEPQNKIQMEWAWGYIKEKQISGAPVRSATTSSEMYLGILEVFDCWHKHPAELKDFRETMKRAWAQHKYRLNLNGRKQSTFVLSVEAKDQLHKMAKTQNINLNQMLEHLINKEFISYKESLKKNKPINSPSIYPNNPPIPASSPSSQEDA